MKRWSMAVAITASILLAGCGNEEELIPKMEVSVGDWVTSIEQKNATTFLYTVANPTKEALEFTFSDGLQVDYTLSKEGEKMYTQSEVVSVTQAVEVHALLPDETRQYEIVLEDLEAGNYQLDVWLTANEAKETDRKTVSFIVQ